jgi:hypothetical protein
VWNRSTDACVRVCVCDVLLAGVVVEVVEVRRWRTPSTGFVLSPPPYGTQTSALKEAVDDLEWPGAAVKVSITRSPDMVSFASTGAEVGSLEVRVQRAPM